MGARLARLTLLLGAWHCGAPPGATTDLPPDLLVGRYPRERVYDRKALGNLAQRSEVAGLRVPHGQSFVIDISVGSPPQRLRCLLDTGLADLWLPTGDCEDCGGRRHFFPNRSHTFAQLRGDGPAGSASGAPRPVQVPYSGGTIVGFTGQDTVVLGWGIFRNQSFFLVPEAFLPAERDWDGICGLGRLSVAIKEEPLWKRLPSASQGGRSVFALVPGPGRLHYFVAGTVPFAACKEGTLSWAAAEPLLPGGDRHFWVISGGLAIHKRNPVPSRFLLDTGSSFLLAPPHKYLAFVRSLFAMEVFDRLCGWDTTAGNAVVCDCSIMKAASRLLPVRFYIGDRDFLLQVPELFVRVPTGGGEDELCLLQIQGNPSSAADPLDVLGDLLDSDRADSSSRRPAADGRDAGRPATFSNSAETAADGAAREVSFPMAPGPVLLPQGKPPSLERQDAPEHRRLQALGQPSADIKDDLWIIGGVFLERFVVVLDYEGQRVGVAEPAGEASAGGGTKPGSDFAVQAAAQAIDGQDPELKALEEQNSDLRGKLHALVREQEEAVLRHMKQEEERNDMVAEIRSLDQERRNLENRLQLLEYSQEQAQVRYANMRQKAAMSEARRSRLRDEAQDLRSQNLALRAHSSRIRTAAFCACGVLVVLLLCAGVGAWKARRELLLLSHASREGRAREVRDRSPLLEPDPSPDCSPDPSPPLSPKGSHDVNVAVE